MGGHPREAAQRERIVDAAPEVLRIGDATPRGYSATDLGDAWRRYVLPTRQEAQQAQQRNTQQNLTQNATEETPEICEKPTIVADVADVALFPGGQRDVALGANVADADLEERAAILEFDGGLSRAEAETRAVAEMPDIPEFLIRRSATR